MTFDREPSHAEGLDSAAMNAFEAVCRLTNTDGKADYRGFRGALCRIAKGCIPGSPAWDEEREGPWWGQLNGLTISELASLIEICEGADLAAISNSAMRWRWCINVVLNDLNNWVGVGVPFRADNSSSNYASLMHRSLIDNWDRQLLAMGKNPYSGFGPDWCGSDPDEYAQHLVRENARRDTREKLQAYNRALATEHMLKVRERKRIKVARADGRAMRRRECLTRMEGLDAVARIRLVIEDDSVTLAWYPKDWGKLGLEDLQALGDQELDKLVRRLTLKSSGPWRSHRSLFQAEIARRE